MPTVVRRASGEAAWVAAAIGVFVDQAKRAIERRGAFHVVVPGGSTPRRVFHDLTESGAEVEWPRVHIYFGDERCVPPDDPSSNYRMIRESLLEGAPIPLDQIHRLEGELDARAAANRYNERLMSLLGTTAPPATPADRFDAVILGLGPDGHTASLIPGVDLDYVAEPWVGVGPAPMSPAQVTRLTLTPAALRATRETIFWVRGQEKAAVVRAALFGDGMRTMVPEVIDDAATVTWVLDAAAAGRLSDPEAESS